METGPAWFETWPGRMVCEFDRHACRDIQIDWTDLLADMGAAYADHLVMAGPMMDASMKSASGNVTKDRVRIADGQTPTLGQEYPITWRLIAADGQSDDRTLYFRIVEK